MASSSANRRTDASDAKSQTIGMPPPAACAASGARTIPVRVVDRVAIPKQPFGRVSPIPWECR